MSFSSKHRRLNRRERYKRDSRNFKVTVIFVAIGLVVYAVMRRSDILFWLKTYWV
nr:hypothetical protein [Saprospiraceae bacterium]